MDDYFTRLRLITRDVRLLLVSSALVGFSSWGGIYSVLLNLYLLRLGYGPRYIGLINGTGMLTVAVFSLLAGVISARVGVRRVLIIGMSCAAFGFVALPLVADVRTDLRASLFLVTYFIGYSGLTLRAVATSPFLAASTSDEARSHAFSWNAGLMGLAGFGGSLVAGILPGAFAALLGHTPADPEPYRYTLLFAGGLLFAGIVPLAATGRVDAGPQAQIKQATRKAPIGIIVSLSLVSLFSVIGEGTARTFFNVYSDTGLSMPTARIGTILAIAQLMSAAASLSMPLLVGRVGKPRTILIGSLARALCLLPLMLIPHWVPASGGLIGIMLFAGLVRPALTAFHQETVASRWRAAISGATTMAAGLGFSVAALGGGYIIPVVGYRGLFLAGAGVSLVGTLIFWLRFILPDRGAAEGSAGVLASKPGT